MEENHFPKDKPKEQIKPWKKSRITKALRTRNLRTVYGAGASYQARREGPAVPCGCIDPINFVHGSDALVLTLCPRDLAEASMVPRILDSHH